MILHKYGLEIILFYIAFEMITYLFLPVFVTIFEYHTTKKCDFETNYNSYQDIFKSWVDVIFIIMVFPIVWIFYIFDFLINKIWR